MAKNAVEILIRARDGATKPLEEVKKAVKGVGDEAKAGVRPLREYRDELKHQEKQLEQVARNQDKASEEYCVAVEELARVKSELKGVNSELANQETALGRVGSGMTRFGTAMSLGVTAPLVALAGVGVSSAMQLETFAASLEVLIGDAERANDVFDQLYEFSANTPFDWRSLTEGTRVLAAFGTEAEDIVPTLDRLGDVAAGVQTPIEQLAEIYGRVQLTGRLGMEEVNRLAERGIPIYTELARQLGVTEGEVRDLVSAGEVGFPQLERMFVDLTSEGGKFFGMMEAQSATTEGRLNTLRDSFEQVTDIIGERLLPAVDAMIRHAQAAVDWFVNLDEATQGLFVGLGVTLAATGPVLVGVGTLLQQLPRLVRAFQLLRTTLLPFLGPLGILAGAVAGYIALSNAMDAGREPREKAQESFDNLIERMQTYRQELVITSEAERQEAIEALNRQRRVLEVTIANQQAFVRSVEADVIAFANKGFFGQLFSFGEANVNLRTLEQAEQHLDALQGQLAAVDGSIERIASLEIPGPKSDVPALTGQVRELGDATKAVAELPDPEEAVQSWAAAFVERLQTGVEQAREGWRGTLVTFGEVTGTLLRNALGLDQPENEFVATGRAIVEAVAEGVTNAFPSLETRLNAALGVVRNRMGQVALQRHVESGDALRVPDGTGADLRSPYIPPLMGLPARDTSQLEASLVRYSEALFGPRSAPSRFLADLEALFATAAREADRADRVERYTARQNALAAQDARFDEAGRLAYHDRVINDPRSAGFRRDIPLPGAFAGLPDARALSTDGVFALVPDARDLTGPIPPPVFADDTSALPDEKRAQVLRQELEARQALVDGLLELSTEKGALANFGSQLLAVAAEQVPAFGAALNGFVQAGPVGAVIGFFSELLASSEPMQEAFLAINEALAPLGELLGRIIAPALKLLGTVIGWVVDALVAIYNFLLGWLFGRVERDKTGLETETPRTYDHSSEPPASREMDFGRVGPGVQLAVATPLVEAAQLSLTAAQLQVTAANSLASVFTRVEALYTRLLEEGFRVKVELATPAATTSSGTAFLR